MYKKILLGLFLLTNTVGVQAYGIGEGYDQLSQINFYVGLMAPMLIDYYSVDEIIKELPPVGSFTEKFIKNLFTIYYPEIDNDKVHILFSQNVPLVPFVYNKSGEFYVVVPICDRTLLYSINAYFEKIGREQISIPVDFRFQDDGRGIYYPEDQFQILAQNSSSLDFLKQQLHQHFKYIDASLFPTYVGLLIHEGAHVLHKDFNNRLLFCSIPLLIHTAGIAGWELSKNAIPQDYKVERLFAKAIARAGALSLSYLLGKMTQRYYQRNYVEATADKEAVNRIDNKIVAEALVDFFEGHSQQRPSILSRMSNWLLLDTHPADNKRAALFAESARTIQDSDNNKFEQLIELTCEQFRNCEVVTA